MRSSICPDAPTKGLPSFCSCHPGASPTIARRTFLSGKELGTYVASLPGQVSQAANFAFATLLVASVMARLSVRMDVPTDVKGWSEEKDLHLHLRPGWPAI